MVQKWDRVLDDTKPPFYQWFLGAELNTCYNTLDRHVEGGRADQTALIYDSPVTKQIKHYVSRAARPTAKFAGVLRTRASKRRYRCHLHADGTRGCCSNARLCAPGRSAFGGLRRFRSHELAIRIDDAKPNVVITASEQSK
jgi:propionyl-CoA synthetase